MAARVSIQSSMDEGMGRTQEVVQVDDLDAPKLPPGVNVLLASFPNIGFACSVAAAVVAVRYSVQMCQSLRNNEKI